MLVLNALPNTAFYNEIAQEFIRFIDAESIDFFFCHWTSHETASEERNRGKKTDATTFIVHQKVTWTRKKNYAIKRMLLFQVLS